MKVTGIVIAFFVVILLSSIPVDAEAGFLGLGGVSKPARTVASYEEAGRDWGNTLWKAGKKPSGPFDDEFINALKDNSNIDFFNLHSDLKDAFKKGFRMGYEDRMADLVLGPHIIEAAARIGTDTSSQFVNAITAFEEGWAGTLRHAIEVFIVLISEGSQADRELFIKRFESVYTDKYNKTQEILKARNVPARQSEGGTMLYLDYSKGKTLGTLDIPKPDSLQIEIYHQAFRIMGDEWGRRYSTNLIRRDELIDQLRRSKTALEEIPGNNIGIILEAFRKSYGADADSVFNELARSAGYKETITPQTITPRKEATPEIIPAVDAPRNKKGKK